MKLRYVLILLLLTLPMAGCFYSREIAQTRRDLERQYPGAHFDREVVVSLGPGSLRALGWIAGLVPEDEPQMARRYLREISRIKVGVYKTDYLPNLEDFDPPSLDRFRRDGWEMAVKTQEDNEAVWVLYKERDGAVRDIYAIVLSEDELVLARVKGHLDRLLEKVMEDQIYLREITNLEVGMEF
jgi:hypothetical protein